MVNNITGSNNPVAVSSMREWMGNAHFMRQLERQYDFDVSVFKLNDSGERELIRVE